MLQHTKTQIWPLTYTTCNTKEHRRGQVLMATLWPEWQLHGVPVSMKWPLAQHILSVVSVATLHQTTHDMLVREHACCLFLNNYITIMFAIIDKSLYSLVTSPGQRNSMINNVTVMRWKSVPQAITWMLWCLGANHLSIPATTPLYK